MLVGWCSLVLHRVRIELHFVRTGLHFKHSHLKWPVVCVALLMANANTERERAIPGRPAFPKQGEMSSVYFTGKIKDTNVCGSESTGLMRGFLRLCSNVLTLCVND